jgi:SAM-dependent methyltransferase
VDEVDRSRLSVLAHARHPLAAPLSDDSARALLQHLPVPPDGSVLDVGCGTGVWLRLLLTERRDLRAVGVDLSEPALAAAAGGARAAGVGDRVRWLRADGAAPVAGLADAAMCVGSTHVFGGLTGTLTALRDRVRPGGALVVGDGFWEQPPSAAAREVIGDLPALPELVTACHDAGWAVVTGHVSSAQEWDDYEWSWAGALTAWGLDHRGTPDGDTALGTAREHLHEWLAGYRGQLGFVVLVLADAR